MEISLDKKRILALLGLIAATAALGTVIYFVFFRTAPSTTPLTPEEEITPGQLPTGETAGPLTPGEITPEEGTAVLPTAAAVSPTGGSITVAVSPLVTSPTLNSTLSADGKGLQFYNQFDGKFYTTDSAGNLVPLSDETFPAVKNFNWSPNKNMAVMEFPDNNKIVYDFQKEKQYSIPKHWGDLNFTTDSQQLVGKTDSPDPNARYLFVSRPDGTGAVPLETLGENGNKVLVAPSPNNQVVAFSRTADPIGGSADRQGILLIGKNHENFRQLTVEGLGFQPLWSPSGDRLVYSVYNSSSDFKPSLWIDGGSDEAVGKFKKDLGVQTWAQKCTFVDKENIICAVPDPTTLITGIGFDPTSATDTNDSLYKINLLTGAKNLIAKPEGRRTIAEINLSSDGKYLFLKDQNSGALLKMLLK